MKLFSKRYKERNRRGLGLAARIHSGILAAAFVVAAAGCGGGGGGGNGGGGGGGGSRTPVRLTVQWSGRSRQVNPPSSALSGQLTIQGGNPDGSNFTFKFNRDPNRPDSYSDVFTSPNEARTGSFAMTLKFFSETNQGGVLVGQANQNVQVNPGGDLGNINLNNTVASVQVAPGQAVGIGEQVPLTVVTRDAQGNIVPVSPGSNLISVVNGQDKLIVVGEKVQGVQNGVAQVRVTVDGITSPVESVGVGGVQAAVSATGLRSSAPVTVRQNETNTFPTVEVGQSFNFSMNFSGSGQVEVPAGYGDRQFVKWTLNGQDFSTNPSLTLSAANFSGGSLVAVFQKREPVGGQFTPNYYQSDYPRWSASNFPLRVFFEARPDVSATLRDRLFNSMKKWERATGGVISYVRTDNAAEANIVVNFGTIPQNPQAGGSTTLSLDGATGEIFDARITINQVLIQTAATSNALDIVATHEFGHALGITNRSSFPGASNGHSTDATDTMFPSGNPGVAQITERDMNTLSTIYLPELTRSRAVSAVSSGKTRAVPATVKTLTVTCGDADHTH
jgi:predicted Zn-dependent protease